MAIRLYAPLETKNDLRIDYPELADVREFAAISPKQLFFVYYFSNRTSPYYHKEGEEKVRKCIKASGLELNREEEGAYLNSHFDNEVMKAMERMERFSPSVRVRAKLLQERMFRQFEDMVDVIDAELKTTEAEGRKALIDTLAKINDKIPELVDSLEAGWGIRETKGEDPKEKKTRILDSILNAEED